MLIKAENLLVKCHENFEVKGRLSKMGDELLKIEDLTKTLHINLGELPSDTVTKGYLH